MRERVLWPLVHEPQADQSPTTQSTLSQAAVSVSVAHATPPLLGCVTTTRVRVFLPHEASQLDQAPQSPTRQSVQVWESVSDVGHAAPPYAAGEVIVRVRVRVPFAHALQAHQSLTTQSTLSQVVVSLREVGQAAPPLVAAWVTVRVWVLRPEVALHADHAVQSLTLQSVQACVSVSVGHTAPPYAAAVVTLRVRVL